MGFRENLRQELSYNDMVVKELAESSGVHKRALDTYLCKNASMPPADAAVSIARALGVTVEYLVSGEEPALPRDIREISRSLLKLGEKDRRIVSALVKTMVEQREEK
ncbi:transcriptional regulator [Spirochaetia bacterium]|nr:transcriptional regulator [Spirochaetia bacterium]